MWPVDDPPPALRRRGVRLAEVPAAASVPGVPANTVAALQAVAQGLIELQRTKDAYDGLTRSPPAPA